jgi:HlyD family secretion protein
MNNKTNSDIRSVKRGKKRKKKFLIFFSIAVLIVVIIVLNLNGPSDPDAKKGSTAKVEYGGILDRLTETGTIELVRSIDVKSKISGKIKEILVKEGQEVRANQLLAIVEPDPNQVLMLYAKRAAVDRAEIEYIEKEKELNRNQALFEKSLISRQELEKIENLFRLSSNAFKQAELEQEILEMEMTEASTGTIENINSDNVTQLDDYRIIAPISGIVIGSEVEVGEMVVTGISSYMVGTTIFQIGDPSEMIVKSSISEIDIGRLKIGLEVRIISDSYPDEVYLGKVKNIAPVGRINQGASIVTFDVEIEILDPDVRLRQGMSCDIDIIFDTRENVLVLPVEAIHEVMAKDTEGEETSVVDYLVAYKWSENDYQEVRVEIGLESKNRIEILIGLVEDDEVSLEASKKYKEFQDKEKEVKQEDKKTKTK